MSILRNLTTPERRDAVTDELARRRSHGAPAGIAVTPTTAIQHSAVWACTNLIANTISTLPLHEYTPGNHGRLERVPTSQILAEPSAEVDLEDWIRQIIVSDLLRGNAYGLVVARDKLGRPLQIEIEHPDVVGFKSRKRHEPLVFTIDGKTVGGRYPLGDIFHVPAYVMPGSPLGLSPIAVARQAISVGLAAEKYAADWYRRGGHPTGALTTKEPVPDKETADTVRARFKEAVDTHGVAVLGLDMKYEAIQIKPADAAFLEVTGANLATIARYFGLEPPMIGAPSPDSQTYANVESRALNTLTFNLNHWLIRLERKFSSLLPVNRVARFNPDALARVNLKTRFEAHGIAIRSGFKTQNEVRELENLPPVDDGDVVLWPPLRAFPTDTDSDKESE